MFVTVKNLANQIKVVLFDLGGVLVELHGMNTMLGWLNNKLTPDEFWSLWLSSPVVRQFESGRATPEEFADQIISDLALPVGKQDFLAAFTSWAAGLYPGALELVRSVPEQFTRATLCNTSVLHWSRLMSDFELEPAFHHHFASHITGRLKPDQEAFEHVVEILGCKPSSVFFMDDNRLNVDAAQRSGMHAVRVNGPVEARKALIEAGIVSTSPA
jgi:glucose-1-phosphatase